MHEMVSTSFILKAKVALTVMKTRIKINTNLYSALKESYVRSHPKYPELLRMRKLKPSKKNNEDEKESIRKETAKFEKKLLEEVLENQGMTLDDFEDEFKKFKANSNPLQQLVKTEKLAFKEMSPLLKEIALWYWIKSVKGLGPRYGVKLLCHVRDPRRFPCPSKLRKYSGIVPGLKRVKGQEAHFDPELKGVLLGQIAKNFLMNNSQYRKIYDDKKEYYTKKYTEELKLTEQKKSKKQKITKDDWTPAKIHNYAKRVMIKRFVIELWMASYLVNGEQPPRNPYIVDIAPHHMEPMLVPVTEEILTEIEKAKKKKTKAQTD